MLREPVRPARPSPAAPSRAPIPEGRTYDFGVWWLALGYCLFYAPYSALAKATTHGLIPGVAVPDPPVVMLPAIGLATAVVTNLVVTSRGWWRYCCVGSPGAWRFHRPESRTVVSGVATAAIIYTTTLMFTFNGVSIVLALLIMRGGVLVLAPSLDLVFGRRVRWFAWTGLALSLIAVAVSASLVSHQLTWFLAATSGTYLFGYVIRLHCVNTVAKAPDRSTSYRYFAEEQLVATTTLVMLPLVLALLGNTSIAVLMRQGLTSFMTTTTVWPAFAIGALYGALYCCGTLIYLDRRENTFCITLNRSASLLAGLLAAFTLTAFTGARPPSAHELAGAALILIAILVLSPAHHAVETLAIWRRIPRPALAAHAPAPPLEGKDEWR